MLLTALLLTAAAQTLDPASAQGEYLKPLIDFSLLCQPVAEGEGHRVFHGRTQSAGSELLRLEGSGVIRRIWFPKAHGELRFHFGEEEEPVFRLDLANPGAHPSFGGNLVGRSGGSFDCLVPVPFPDGVRLTASDADLDFRIEVQTAASADGLELPDAGFWARQAEAYGLVSDLVERGEFLVQPRKRTSTFGRIRTNSRIVCRVSGGGTIHKVRIQITNAADLDLDRLFRGLRFRVVADKQRLIDVPLGDFFGASSALPVGSSHLLRIVNDPADGMILECFLPMPFSDRISIALLNESFEVPLCRFFTYWSDADFGSWRLHAGWKLERGVSGDYDCRVLDADGPGRLLGAGIAIRGAGFGGEVDASGFFGLPPGDLVAGRRPFQGVGSGNGWVSFDRLMPGAGIPFDGEYQLDLPLHLGDEPVDLATIAWWYAPADAGHRLGELPDSPDRRLR